MKKFCGLLFGALVTLACGPAATPKTKTTLPNPLATPEPRWDDTLLGRVDGESFVFAGPLFFPEGAEQPGKPMSPRCLALAFGWPDVAYDMAYSASGLPAAGELPAEQARARDWCAEVYGNGWRLPTVTEAREVLTPWRRMFGPVRVFAWNEAEGELRTMRRRWTLGSFYVIVEEQPPVPSSLYCVAPAAQRPAADAPRAEILGCIAESRRFLGIWPVPADWVDPGVVDFVLAARAACAKQRDPAPLLGLVRAELGDTGVAWRTAALEHELMTTTERLAAVREAIAAVEPPVMVDCRAAPIAYDEQCRASAVRGHCVTLQATFATACMSIDVTRELRASERELAFYLTVVEQRSRRHSVVARAVKKATSCSPPGADSPYLGLDDEPYERPREPACVFPGLECIFHALRTPLRPTRNPITYPQPEVIDLPTKQ